jgi:hypothetical protein
MLDARRRFRVTSAVDRRIRAGEILVVLAGAALLAVSWTIVAGADRVPGWEADTFEVVNDLPGVLWPVLWGPMQLGSLVGSLVVVVVIHLVGRNLRLTLAALVASQVAWWTAKAVKGLVARDRPDLLLTGVHVRDSSGGLGYVSGHAAVAFALAAVVAASVERLGNVARREELQRPLVNPLRVRSYGEDQHHVGEIQGLTPRRRADLREGNVDQEYATIAVREDWPA